MKPRYGPVDGAILAAIERERRRLEHAVLPDEKRMIRESIARWIEQGRQSREPLTPREGGE